MLSHFFQLTPVPINQMTGTYNLWLVVLSYMVATFASYIALDLTGRLRDLNNTPLSSTMWLLGGAFAMGAGIWSMHFIGMLAFSMPMMVMSYSPLWTFISMIVAILASGFALLILKTKIIKPLHLILGGIILGLAIASMHYIGMYAMHVVVNIHYLPHLFILSIIIAIIASEAALWLALKSNQVIASMRFRLKFFSAFIMGAAICGMHYTGMAAAVFTPADHMPMNISTINPTILSVSIAGVTFFILGIAALLSTYKEAKNQQLLAMARQAGMAEVAASVLHNVGNVLNSVNTSASVIAEKISKSKISELEFLSALIKKNQHDLANFFMHDEKGAELPHYIETLYLYWKNEKKILIDEINILIKNIDHIKNIIAMQQNLSKTSKVEQIIEVDKTLDEALLMAGIQENYPHIHLIKEYKQLHPVIIDKVKLLQIIVNLLHNAKDAVVKSNNAEKQLILRLSIHHKDTIYIQVIDNGVGVKTSDLTRIFAYGFTTKENGHGFGLHSSALAAKDMGGSLFAHSDGPGKGASFTLELPYRVPEK